MTQPSLSYRTRTDGIAIRLPRRVCGRAPALVWCPLDRHRHVAYLAEMNQPWLRIAHRGASGTAPELTRSAFERALAIGVDMIELDVQFSRDLELVVFHDVELQRTTSGRGLVREHEFAELKRLDAGSWFGSSFAAERVLSLKEVI